MSELNRSATFEARRAQMFPVLAPWDVERLRRFATQRSYSAGESLFETGKPSPGMLVVLSGIVRISGRDGRGHDVTVVEIGSGQFTGEVGSLAGGRAFVDARAAVAVDALLIAADRLRAVLVAEAELGERIMRALILRRVAIIETGAGGPVLIGSPTAPDVARLRNFLARNGIPHMLFDPATDPDAQAFVAQYAPASADMPLVVCPDGSVLRNPTESVLGRCIGMLDAAADGQLYDVAIVGAGPAGLATAVYAGADGLTAIVMDARAFGGQAGASARIENYLGFPTGISGMALAGRAYTQARKFGAHMLIPSEIIDLDCERERAGDPLVLHLSDGRTVRSRTVVIASGARYRRPDCEALKTMEGRGIWYWASPIEAKMCAGEEVVLVGGGNSAGQGAVFLASHASRVWMLVRGSGLAESMSRYLIDRITATSNIELLTRTEIVDVEGSRENGVERVRWRHRDSGQEETRALHNVFLFLGAEPATEWLKRCGVALDDRGFVLTGAQQPSTGALAAAGTLTTSVPGVFAIGDVRSGSVKRVGGAIGEGAAVIAQVHAFLARANG